DVTGGMSRQLRHIGLSWRARPVVDLRGSCADSTSDYGSWAPSAVMSLAGALYSSVNGAGGERRRGGLRVREYHPTDVLASSDVRSARAKRENSAGRDRGHLVRCPTRLLATGTASHFPLVKQVQPNDAPQPVDS